jgi:hypothetical protein
VECILNFVVKLKCSVAKYCASRNFELYKILYGLASTTPKTMDIFYDVS